MEVTFLQENHRKRFAVLPYRDYLYLVELAGDEKDYQKALKVLQNAEDKIVNYNSSEILKNPIATAREKRGFSQRDLAKRMKVDPSYVSRLEKAGANPSKKTLERAALAMGYDIEELLSFEFPAR